MAEAKSDLIREVLSMTLKDALRKLTDDLTPAQVDAATSLEKKIDKSAYRYDEETGTLFPSKFEHRQVALAALSLAIDAMVNGTS